jgi:transglutaminase-like putative cysteine protease
VKAAAAPFDVPPLLERRSVRWAEVRSVQHTLHQSFSYHYPGPIRDLKHALMVTPRSRYGAQELCSFELSVTPPFALQKRTDAFGNAVLELEVDEVVGGLEFHLLSTLHNVAAAPPVRLSEAEVAPFREPTRLTRADARMRAVAKEQRRTYAGPLAFAAALSEWVYHEMTYGFGATGTRTSAAEALAGGVGLCQDYAHIMVAMCRAAGVAARYVSGHMLGEGGSHAWAEVLLPERGGYAAYSFDPTNRRRPGLDYVTVAVGRDYSDVPPTAGSFSAPYSGELSCTKKAGLTRVEYRSGEVVSAS